MQTPADYAARYEELTVPSLEGSADLATGIAVDRYLLKIRDGGYDERTRLGQKIQKDLTIRRRADKSAKIRVRVDTPGGVEEREFDKLELSDSDQLWLLLRYPYTGKGSPEGVQAILQLASVELPGSPAMVKPANFQAYCDKWLGLDCNGLVGNYLRHVWKGIHWSDVTATASPVSPNNDIKAIWNGFDGTVRSSAAEVSFKDLNLLVMLDPKTGEIRPGGPGHPPGHIMISQPHEIEYDTGLKSMLGVPDDKEVPGLIVLESTGAKDSADKKDGVAKSAYAFVDQLPPKTKANPNPKPNGVFKVRRGLNNTGLFVRIKGAAWSG